jgi:hypothetical protein
LCHLFKRAVGHARMGVVGLRERESLACAGTLKLACMVERVARPERMAKLRALTGRFLGRCGMSGFFGNEGKEI